MKKILSGLLINLILAVITTTVIFLPDILYFSISDHYKGQLNVAAIIVVFASYFLAFSGRSMRPVIIVSGLYSVIIASQIIHHIYFGVWIAPTDVSLLFSEIDEILLSLTTIWKEIIATVLVVLTAFVAVMRLVGKFKHRTQYIPLMQLVLIWIYLGIIPPKAYKDPSVQNYYPSPQKTSLENGINFLSWVVGKQLGGWLLGDESNSAIPEFDQLQITKKNKPEKMNIILVMGESLNPNHMQAFGYHRETTPFLNEYVKNNEIKIKEIYSGGLSTKVSIPTFFNLKRYPQDISVFKNKEASLPFMAATQGFETWWLSTQTAGLATYVTGIKRENFVSKDDHWDEVLKFHDEYLLELIKKVDFSRSNFIVLHERGSHSPYDKFHPKEFDKFSDNSDGVDSLKSHRINSYDNSILYSDYVHKKIIDHVNKKSQLPSVVIFTADHGELQGENGWWGHSQLYPEVARVPLIVWSKGIANEDIEQLMDLRFPTHFELGVNIAKLLGYEVVDPNEKEGVYFANGKSIDGSAPFLQLEFAKNGDLNNWNVSH